MPSWAGGPRISSITKDVVCRGEPGRTTGSELYMHATATITPADSQCADQRDDQQQQRRPGLAHEERQAAYEQRAERQYMRALERANEVRIARAELKRKVAAGAADVAELVLECPWEAQSMAVSDLLTSQRRWGQTRCRKLLAQVPMSERKTLGSMTDRQRRTLAGLLSGAEQGESSGLVRGERRNGEVQRSSAAVEPKTPLGSSPPRPALVTV
jgi:hypothetical protein